MSSSNEIRQLAGIMFTDIVGYTRMMGEDEARAIRVLANQRKLLFPIVEKHEGKVLKEMGDGLLIMFTSVIKAVRCAIEIQNAEKDFVLRIGIHIGDVVMQNDDVFGSGVNIAARVEGLATPGSVCITADVWHQISNQTDLHVKSLGVKDLKGVHESVEVFEITKEEIKQSKAEDISSRTSRRPAILKNKPVMYGIPVVLVLLIGLYFFMPDRTASPQIESSIAVLPFENLSLDPEDAYFADGVHEDIIVHLSQIGDMHVIARSSVLSFKPGERNLTSIANNLNVASVLEGNIRRAGDVVRVSVQLIDPRSNQSLWAEIYDREITDIFSIQSEIAREIAGALEVRMTTDEERAIDRVHTENLEAYRYYVLGRSLWDQRTEDGMRRSVEYFQQAIEQDSGYALAWSGLADALSTIKFYNLPFVTDLTARDAALRALELNPKLGEARASLGIALAVDQQGSRAVRELEQAIVLLPSYAEAHLWLGWLHLVLGRPDKSLEPLEKAVKLNPLAPAARAYLAEGYLVNGQYDNALREAQHARELQPDYGFAHFIEALVLYHLKQHAEAKTSLQVAMSFVRPGGLPDPSDVMGLLAITHISMGDFTSARELLSQINEEDNPFTAAIIYAALDDKEAAFEYFDKVLTWNDIPVIYLRYLFPEILGEYRTDSRFQRLLNKINQSWI